MQNGCIALFDLYNYGNHWYNHSAHILYSRSENVALLVLILTSPLALALYFTSSTMPSSLAEEGKACVASL